MIGFFTSMCTKCTTIKLSFCISIKVKDTYEFYPNNKVNFNKLQVVGLLKEASYAGGWGFEIKTVASPGLLVSYVILSDPMRVISIHFFEYVYTLFSHVIMILNDA